MKESKKIDLSSEIKETYQLIIDCENEEDLKKLFEKLSQEGYKCQVLIL